MLIGELCKRAGVTKDTVRHYGELGLLVFNEVEAGCRHYRNFAEENIERIELVRLSKYMGFTLREISSLMTAYYAGDITAAQQASLLSDKLELVKQKQKELSEVEAYLNNKLRLLKHSATPAT